MYGRQDLVIFSLSKILLFYIHSYIISNIEKLHKRKTVNIVVKIILD